MDVGHALITAVLQEPGFLKTLLAEGFDLPWLTDPRDLSRAAIFGERDIAAYQFILKYWEEHRAVTTEAYFRHSYPTFELDDAGLSPEELIELARKERTGVQLKVRGSEFIDLYEEGDYEGALAVMERTVREIKAKRSGVVHIAWDSRDYDLDARINREIVPGIGTGIRELDKCFAGWQRGDLITLLGRAKAAKTSHLIKAALHAHEQGKRVLLLSVEIKGESIADRCDCFSAGVEFAKYAQGDLDDDEKEALWDVNIGEDEKFHIVQPMGTYTVSDLEMDIDRYQPDAVFLDGFYFLIDSATGKPGSHYEGHDNLARDLKALAMRKDITIILTMQVREKQARGGKNGDLDDNTMMGGTGLIMFSDMVLTLDMDKETGVNKIACSRSRTRYLPTIRGRWNWTRKGHHKAGVFEIIDESFGEGDDDDE